MKRENAKKLLGYAGKAALVLLLLVNLLTLLLSAADLRSRLRWLPFAVLSVESGSMEPALSRGDLVVVWEAEYSALRIGDDVTFLGADELVTHRIIGLESNGFITRGIANNTEDPLPMTPEEYCGKVVLAVPVLGHVLRWVSASHLTLALLALLVLAVCFGGPLARKLAARGAQAEEQAQRRPASVRMRLLVCLCALSVLCCVPAMTGAKYTDQLNRHELAIARPLYFSSNYLGGEDGNTYSILGWNGKAYSLTLQIRNYNNSLLFNDDQTPLTYGLGYRMVVDDEFTGDYTIEFSKVGEMPVVEDFYYPDDWGADGRGITALGAYRLDGGAKAEQSFMITLKPNGEGDEPKLPADAKVHFELYACTDEQTTYDMELMGTFRLQVAKVFEFIGETQVSDSGSMVGLSVSTNLINDATDEKIVVFHWDPSKLYINEFERTAFNVITNNPGYYNKDAGLLYMKLQAYSRVNLEFFKKMDFDATGGDFAIAVVNAVGDPPPDLPTTLPLSETTPEENTTQPEGEPTPTEPEA